MERAVVLCQDDQIGLADLPLEIATASQDPVSVAEPKDKEDRELQRESPVTVARHLAERSLITTTLTRHEGRVADAARELGIHRATLYRKMKALGIVSPT